MREIPKLGDQIAKSVVSLNIFTMTNLQARHIIDYDCKVGLHVVT